MQPFSSTHVPLSDVTSNPSLNEPTKTNPTGTLGKFAVAVQSGITTFFSSLSPNYVPEHQRQTNQPTAPVVNMLPAENKNDKTSLVADVVQGVGLASKVLSCWVPNASAVSDAVGTLCSSFSLANSLDNMAVSGKSGKPGKEPTSGSENVPKPLSQEITNKHQEDEKPGKPVTASGTTNSVSGPAMATVTLMAMDRLAGAAALPPEEKPGSRNNPICNGSEICVNGSEILGKIGQEGYPPNGAYRQTKSFSHNSGVAIGNESTPFTGRYDGGGHTISDPQRCLFRKLGSGAIVHDLNVANGAIENSERYSAALACEMGENSTVLNILVEDTRIINKWASDRTSTGVITGLQQKGSRIECAVVKNCSVTTSERYSDAGIGAGKMSGEIEHLAVTDNSWVLTSGDQANAGIGGGKVCGDIRKMTVVNSWATTYGEYANVAIGGGMVGGFGTHCERGLDGSVNDLVALHSSVRTNGSQAYAGIGGGEVAGEVSGVIAINCTVTTANKGGAGIGAGYGNGNETDIQSFYSWVNGDLQKSSFVDSTEPCRTVDSRLVNDGCQLTDSLLGDHWYRTLPEDHWYRNCSTSTASSNASARARSTDTRQPSLVPQPTSATINKAVTADTPAQQPAMTSLSKTAMANATSPLSGSTLRTPTPLSETVMSNTTITGHTITPPLPSFNATVTNAAPLAMAAMTTPAPVTETVVASPEASMTFTGMPPTALPITPPLVTTLNTGLILGVSLGTAFTILAGIGLYAFYQYHRRGEAPKQAEPEIPLDPLKQQANN